MKHTILLALALTIASCKPVTEEAKQTTTTDQPFAQLILSEAPENPQSITDLRKDPTPGKQITLTGKVMGRDEPFVEGRAIMTLGDPNKLTSCDLRPGDSCTTPWDVCCDEPELIKASVATIQVIDANGKLVKHGLKGTQGIKELSNLIITGTIAEGSSQDNLLINATGIYIQN